MYMLYIVSTPIGNLSDITYRAVEILKKVDIILAEDTRRTGVLLNNYNIKNKLISYNDVNKTRKTTSIIKELQQGKEIALVSDSGTPGISDPGFYLVREAIKNNIKIIPVPGANAAITALISSGLPTDKFTFYGFFPKKQSKQKKIIDELPQRRETAIFYESPHRIKKTILFFSSVIPEYNIVIGREITKKFEEFIRGTVKEVSEEIKDKNIKGEITIVLSKK